MWSVEREAAANLVCIVCVVQQLHHVSTAQSSTTPSTQQHRFIARPI